MCQYCEGGKRKKPLAYKSYGNNYSYTDSYLFKINIGNNTLNIKVHESVYHPHKIDDDGDIGVLEDIVNIGKRIKINYCPICGRKL